MIYIDYRYDREDESASIFGVYSVDCENPGEKYNEFIIRKAVKIDLVVSPKWFNVLWHSTHNSHLTKTEYNSKCKQWKKILKEFSIEWFILNELHGEKLEYKYL